MGGGGGCNNHFCDQFLAKIKAFRLGILAQLIKIVLYNAINYKEFLQLPYDSTGSC